LRERILSVCAGRGLRRIGRCTLSFNRTNYKVLGGGATALRRKIKQAYRKLAARQIHPDCEQGKGRRRPASRSGEPLRSTQEVPRNARLAQPLGKGLGRARFSPASGLGRWGARFWFRGAGARESDDTSFFEALFGARARAGADIGAADFILPDG